MLPADFGVFLPRSKDVFLEFREISKVFGKFFLPDCLVNCRNQGTCLGFAQFMRICPQVSKTPTEVIYALEASKAGKTYPH